MTRQVILSPSARAEAGASLTWLKAKRGPDYAEKWHRRMRTAIESLSTAADTWPEALEAVWYGSCLREMIVGRRHRAYRVLFEIRGHVVWVLRIRHVSQDSLRPDDL
jgi:plasmid stabilization system protein ParE